MQPADKFSKIPGYGTRPTAGGNPPPIPWLKGLIELSELRAVGRQGACRYGTGCHWKALLKFNHDVAQAGCSPGISRCAICGLIKKHEAANGEPKSFYRTFTAQSRRTHSGVRAARAQIRLERRPTSDSRNLRPLPRQAPVCPILTQRPMFIFWGGRIPWPSRLECD
jgi:hypothetical protein